MIGWIEHCKHAELLPEQAPDHSWNKFNLRELYLSYQQALFDLERMDFSDLILNVVRLLREQADIAAAIQSRFDHVLVDEYQDTNPLQHEWLSLLCDRHHHLTVVGDDDQSIYGWRGADVRHILEFTQHWPEAGIHRLEENYRSTGSILNLANDVISHNPNRHEKTLRSTRGPGSLPGLLACNDEYDEAKTIARWLEQHHAGGIPWRNMAVLYRSNRQSLAMEQIFRQLNMPYRIIGGVGFFERLEIKDALAFWSLLNHCGDAMHLLRIANKPKRGIGPKALENISSSLNSSGLHASQWLDMIAKQSDRSMSKLKPLAELISDSRSHISMTADAGFAAILEDSGYLESLKALGEIEAESRLENVRALQGYIELSLAEGITPIEFMDRAALLQSGESVHGKDEENPETISFMSLHRAKGLEFDVVAIAGVEEGLLPHQRAIDEGEDALSEERRLLYVGITRAKNSLLLTTARVRRLFGDLLYPKPSRFLLNIPKEHLQQPQQPAPSARPVSAVSFSQNAFNIGDDVLHPTFGDGTILGVEGSGDATRVSVQFRKVGIKRLMLKYASLQRL